VAAFVLGAVLLAGFFLFRDTTPLLTRSALEAARDRWMKNGPADYDLLIVQESDARPAERLEATVRGTQTVRLLRDGNPIDNRDAYTVPGLFAIVEREVEMAGASAPAEGAPRNAILKARFDESLGFPLVFKRIASRRSMVMLVTLRTPQKNAGE
jgi:hypothetical protein